MSEPDSGSDLASVRTQATRQADGWLLNGTKVWTSGAHRAHAIMVLARTSPLDTSDRHSGLSIIQNGRLRLTWRHERKVRLQGGARSGRAVQ
jgi:alkylation response protein AidB-like acyl-CoA dehydrogenase